MILPLSAGKALRDNMTRVFLEALLLYSPILPVQDIDLVGEPRRIEIYALRACRNTTAAAQGYIDIRNG